MTVAAAYGIGVLALALIAWLSRSRAIRIMLILLGMEWLCVAGAVGDDRFWLANPMTIATVALAVTVISRTLAVNALTLTVMGLYGVSMLLALVAALAGYTLERWYFEAINGIFALRLTTVGGWGVWRAVRHRGALGHPRDMVVPESSATLARQRSL